MTASLLFSPLLLALLAAPRHGPSRVRGAMVPSRPDKRRAAMTTSSLPPLISSDGHLEVRPERWTPHMPAKLREKAPRTIKLPDGGDAILVEGQPPYPAPFLDLRAGRTNETWEPIGVTVDDTAGGGAARQRPPREGKGAAPPPGGLPHTAEGARP